MIGTIGILETSGFTPAIVALDVMEKAAGVQIIQAELNDFLGVVLKVTGETAAVAAAIEAGRHAAEQMGSRVFSSILNRPDERAFEAILSKSEISPLLQQNIVIYTNTDLLLNANEVRTVADTPSFALGFLETQGFTAVFEAIDSACKAANVEVLCKEKLGGGYITVVIKGDVAAVKAAVDAGKSKVEGLGKLIAAHVIARPSAAALALLPK